MRLMPRGRTEWRRVLFIARSKVKVEKLSMAQRSTGPRLSCGRLPGRRKAVRCFVIGYANSHMLDSPCRIPPANRSEEHTSELQSRPHIVCRLLLEKKISTVYLHCLRPYRSKPAP